MVTISPLSGGTCKVETSTSRFDVFPEKVGKDTWSLVQTPEKETVSTKIVSWPGEYDFEGVTVRGIGQEEGKQVSFHCTSDGVRIAFIAAPTLAWSEPEVEKLGEVDILVVPADDAKKVQALVEEVDPRVIVLWQAKGGDLGGVAKACGAAGVEPVSEYKVKASGLPQDSRQVIVLEGK